MLEPESRSPAIEGYPLRLFFLLFFPVVLLILGGAWYVGKERIDEEMALIRSSEIANVVMGVRRLDDELHAPLTQLRLLAGEDMVRRVLDSGRAGDFRDMESVFRRLIAYTKIYDKVRWIDEHGYERVRVNNVSGKPVVVPRDQLQAVAENYYFKEGMRLKPGEVYISPLDLNVEHGKVEAPRKPVLRLVTPISSGDGRPRGVLVANIAARTLLDAFTASMTEVRDHAMLLNNEGYWLKHPDAALEWGFMFQRKDTLGIHHPEAWNSVSRIPAGQEELADGLWTWSTVYPLKVGEGRDASAIPTWLVVTHLPREQLEPLTQGAWRTVGLYMLVLLVLYAAIAAWLARAVAGRARALAEAAAAHAEAQAALRLSQAQERFRLMVEANTNGLLVADKSGRIVLVNPALARMFGYEREDLLGQPLEILLPDTARGGHGGVVAAYMRDPAARPMGMGRELFGRRKDGSLFPVEISLSPFIENGEMFVDAFVADISERRRGEQLHRRIEARLQLMMQTNPNGLLVADDQGAIEMANPALERMFGYGPGELLNQPLERLVPEASRHQHARLREDYLKNPTVRAMGAGLGLLGMRKDGGTFPIEVSLASFREDGRVFVQATVVDASRRV